MYAQVWLGEVSMGNFWDIIKNSDSLVDAISNVIDGVTDEVKKTLPNNPFKPKPSSLVFPKGNVPVSNLAYLHPEVRRLAQLAIKCCQDEGYSLKVVETYRTWERQSHLYALGRTQPGSIVTKAQSGESYHNYGLAIDIDPTDDFIGSVFEDLGFEWGARWKSFKDYPHFQMTFGLSISDLKALYAKGGLQHVWDSV